METIASRRNALVGLYRQLARGRRPGDPRVLLDGFHLVEDAREAGLPILVAAFAARRLEDGADGFARLAAALEASGTRVVRASDQVMAAISPVRTSSGLVAIAEQPPATLERALAGADPLVVALADVQDPGNVGASIRVADAAAATGVIAGGASADPFGWKALRGSMGSAFRLPVARVPDLAPAVATASARGFRIVATLPRGGRPLFDAGLTGPLLVLLGGEGAGLPDDLARLADEALSVPMRSPVDSLNVAVTAGVILYEALRQRSGERCR